MNAKPELLNMGCPSPLWISCCNINNCVQFLLEKMTVETIAQPGPDGTTPLMQLFANVSKKKEFSSDIEMVIVYFSQKFGLKKILELSIHFGNVNIFSNLFALGISNKDSKHFAKLATLAEDIDILEIILARFPLLKEYCREIGSKCQAVPMRDKLGLSKDTDVDSQLVKMSAKFPKFNEDLEIPIRKISDSAKSINCLLYTSPSPRDLSTSRMPSSA